MCRRVSCVYVCDKVGLILYTLNKQPNTKIFSNHPFTHLWPTHPTQSKSRGECGVLVEVVMCERQEIAIALNKSFIAVLLLF